MESDTSDGPLWMFQDVHEGGPAHDAEFDQVTSFSPSMTLPSSLPRFHGFISAGTQSRPCAESKVPTDG
jgi:hypothetical protein